MLSKAEAGARLSLAMRIWKKFINWANLNVKRKIGNENQTILIIRKRKMEDTVEISKESGDKSVFQGKWIQFRYGRRFIA